MILSRARAKYKRKHGVKLWVYPMKRKELGCVYGEVKSGHFEEFYNKRSTFLYCIIQGEGKFVLNGKIQKVHRGDVVVAPPKTRIYFLGRMKYLLVSSPAWTRAQEVHVRIIERNEKK